MSDRQKKLQQLLQTEKETYLREIALRAIPESSEVRAKRLEKEALELSQRKETERLVICEEKLRQKFIRENDDIRAENSRLFQLEIAAVQLAQIKEKQDRLHANRETESLVFEYLNQQRYNEQIEREDRERVKLEEQKEIIRKTLQQQIEQKKQRDTQTSDLEEGFFIGKSTDRVSARSTHEPFSDLLDRRKREKENRISQEKEENRKIVQDLLLRERLAVEREHAARIEKAGKLRQFLQQHQEDQRERREWEQDLEKEMEKETAKMDALKASMLAQEELKRQELMSLVMAERNAQVAARTVLINERKERRNFDRNTVEIQVSKDLADLDAEKTRRRQVKLLYAKDLEEQVKMKKESRKEIAETLIATDAEPYICELKQKQKEVYNNMISPHLEKFD